VEPVSFGRGDQVYDVANRRFATFKCINDKGRAVLFANEREYDVDIEHVRPDPNPRRRTP
jgi:hypothetical protein